MGEPINRVMKGDKFIHIKSGGHYKVIAIAEMEASLESVIVYQSETGRIWVRPASEFMDGRFQPIT